MNIHLSNYFGSENQKYLTFTTGCETRKSILRSSLSWTKTPMAPWPTADPTPASGFSLPSSFPATSGSFDGLLSISISSGFLAFLDKKMILKKFWGYVVTIKRSILRNHKGKSQGGEWTVTSSLKDRTLRAVGSGGDWKPPMISLFPSSSVFYREINDDLQTHLCLLFSLFSRLFFFSSVAKFIFLSFA